MLILKSWDWKDHLGRKTRKRKDRGLMAKNGSPLALRNLSKEAES